MNLFSLDNEVRAIFLLKILLYKLRCVFIFFKPKKNNQWILKRTQNAATSNNNWI